MEFVQVGMAIIGEATGDGVERSWYALADVQDGNYLAIDLHPQRLGRCYDCFHETFGEPGYCAVIALSFAELLNRLAAAGDSAFWLEDDFHSYGDAYDDDAL
jgi:antitoxin YokJ